jgi:glycosyltransferase involved in cell wall biosynthesis
MDIATPNALVVDDLPPARRSLRVAMVTETYPPEVNGVAATIARVVQGLQDRGHALQLIRPRQRVDTGEPAAETGATDDEADTRFSQVLLRGLPIPRYPELKMGLPARRALLQLWSRRRPDVVHVVTEGPLGWSALQAAHQLRLPVVSDFRTNFHAYSRHYGVAWLHNPVMAYLRRFHNRCASTMVPTEALRSELLGNGFQRLKVVARGVDTALFDPARRNAELRASWGAAADTPVALYVGRLAPEKNLGALAVAFEAMHALRPDLKLVLVGDGPARAGLKSRLPRAHFAGVQQGQTLAAHYASADLFLFPSLTETYGNVVPEAMASGLAVVAFDCAAAGQLICDAENGVLARGDADAAFLAASQRLARDLPAARAMGRRARQTTQALDWARIVGLVEQAYLQSLCAPGAATAGALAAAQSFGA